MPKEKHLKKILGVSAALALVSPSVAIASPVQTVNASQTSSSEMKSFVKKTLHKYHLRGSVYVIKDGKGQLINVGYSNYGKRKKNGNSKVVAPTGSLQKAVTGAIIQQLIDQGKFTQNTKISKWYPKLRDAKKVTVGHLLTHSSGYQLSTTETNHHKRFSERGAIDWVVKQLNSGKRKKSGKFTYNNVNYILLAGIIQKVTKKSYKTIVKNRIVRPLKLKHTYIGGSLPKHYSYATSYRYLYNRNYQSPTKASLNVASQMPGAGDLFSSPGDYYKIMRGMHNGKILNEMQFHDLTHLKSKSSTYSGGLYLKKSGSIEEAYGNFGSTHFSNWMQLTSDGQSGIVMFLNQTNKGKDQNKKAGYEILNHIKKNTFLKN